MHLLPTITLICLLSLTSLMTALRASSGKSIPTCSVPGQPCQGEENRLALGKVWPRADLWGWVVTPRLPMRLRRALGFSIWKKFSLKSQCWGKESSLSFWGWLYEPKHHRLLLTSLGSCLECSHWEWGTGSSSPASPGPHPCLTVQAERK